MLKWEDAEKLEELLKADRYPSKEWKAASLPERVEWLQKECKRLSDKCIKKNDILIKILSKMLSGQFQVTDELLDQIMDSIG